MRQEASFSMADPLGQSPHVIAPGGGQGAGRGVSQNRGLIKKKSPQLLAGFFRGYPAIAVS